MSETPMIHMLPEERRIVEEILVRHVPRKEVWVFGSRATGEVKRWSDLDLAIISDQPLSLSIMADLREDFSESDLPWKVDVLDWATTSERFRDIIARDKVVLVPGLNGGNT